MLRYWGFRAPFQPVFLENAAHNTAQYGMSRPAGRWRRRQAANHTPRLCVLRYRTNQASNPTQTPRYRSTHGERARGEVNPGDVRPEQAGQERTRPRAGAGPNGPNGVGVGGLVGEGSFRRRKAREIQGILIKITLTRTVIHTPQLPPVKQGKTQVSKK